MCLRCCSAWPYYLLNWYVITLQRQTKSARIAAQQCIEKPRNAEARRGVSVYYVVLSRLMRSLTACRMYACTDCPASAAASRISCPSSLYGCKTIRSSFCICLAFPALFASVLKLSPPFYAVLYFMHFHMYMNIFHKFMFTCLCNIPSLHSCVHEL